MTKLDTLIEGGQEAWARFYEENLAHAVSDLDRFYRALNQYGPWPVYEAIIITSIKKLPTDPLNYVLTVAHSKWKESETISQDEARYIMRIEQAKLQSREMNEGLNKKLERARSRNAADSL